MKDKETGIQTESQEFKSAQQNLKAAFRKMVKKLETYYADNMQKRTQTADFAQERVRTYHAVDNRVTDEQTGDQYSYKHTVGKGDISKIIEERRIKLLTRQLEKSRR